MFGFLGEHYLFIPLAGAALFMVTMIGVSVEDALRRR